MFFFNFSFIIIYFEFSLNNQLSIFIFEIFLWWYFDQSDFGFFCLAFENSVFFRFFKFQDTIFELFIFLVFPSTLKNFRFFLSFFFFFQISICFFHIYIMLCFHESWKKTQLYFFIHLLLAFFITCKNLFLLFFFFLLFFISFNFFMFLEPCV